jgi:hypothetical protein
MFAATVDFPGASTAVDSEPPTSAHPHLCRSGRMFERSSSPLA